MQRQLCGIALALAIGAATLLAAAPSAALTIRYNFLGSGHRAFDGEVDQTDANIAIANFPAGRTNWGADWQNWGEASAAEYTALTASDDSYYQSANNPGWGDNVAHLFEFSVTQASADVTDIWFSVEVSRARATDTQYFYLWNYVTSSYTVLGQIDTGTTDAGVTDYSLVSNVAGIDASNIGQYVSAGGQVTMLSINQDVGFIFGSRWQRFDFLEMTVISTPEPRTALLLAVGLLVMAARQQLRARVSAS